MIWKAKDKEQMKAERTGWIQHPFDGAGYASCFAEDDEFEAVV